MMTKIVTRSRDSSVDLLWTSTGVSQRIHKVVGETGRVHPYTVTVSKGQIMHQTKSSHLIRFATSAAICATLALGTAGVASAGQTSHHHGDDGGPAHALTSDDARGVITALGTNSITLAGEHGGTATTFTTSETTTYVEGSTAATVAALAVGESVNLDLTSTSPQTVTKVTIQLVCFAGTVTAVAGNVISITGRHGVTLTVDVGTTTAYTSGGAASTLAAVVVGAEIKAVGLPGTVAGTLNASSVNIDTASGHHHGHGDGHSSGHGHGHSHH